MYLRNDYCCGMRSSLVQNCQAQTDFAVTRFLMKLFSTSNIDIINDCRSNFIVSCYLAIMIEIRKAKFESKFNICNSLTYYFGLCGVKYMCA